MKPLENKVYIKYTPFKCPVCNGFGTVSFKKIKCHACQGFGFVLIDQETGEIYDRQKDRKNTK